MGEIRRLSEVSESARDAVGARRAPFPGRSRDQEFSALRTHISGEGAETGRDGRVERSGRVFLARGDSYLDAILSLNTAS